MSEFDDLLEGMEEEELRYFTINYEDGTSAEVGILAQFEIEYDEIGTRQEYIVVAELENGDFPDGELEVMPFRFYPDPLNPENFHLGDVESEEEREIVENTFHSVMAGGDNEAEGGLYS